MKIEDLIRERIIDVIRLVAQKDYKSLSEKYLSNDRDINGLIRALDEYWEFWDKEGIVTFPPVEEFDKMEIYEINKPTKAKREFSVTFDLWIDNKRSDLTLDCDIQYYDTQDIRVVLSKL